MPIFETLLSHVIQVCASMFACIPNIYNTGICHNFLFIFLCMFVAVNFDALAQTSEIFEPKGERFSCVYIYICIYIYKYIHIHICVCVFHVLLLSELQMYLADWNTRTHTHSHFSFLSVSVSSLLSHLLPLLFVFYVTNRALGLLVKLYWLALEWRYHIVRETSWCIL